MGLRLGLCTRVFDAGNDAETTASSREHSAARRSRDLWLVAECRWVLQRAKVAAMRGSQRSVRALPGTCLRLTRYCARHLAGLHPPCFPLLHRISLHRDNTHFALAPPDALRDRLAFLALLYLHCFLRRDRTSAIGVCVYVIAIMVLHYPLPPRLRVIISVFFSPMIARASSRASLWYHQNIIGLVYQMPTLILATHLISSTVETDVEVCARR